MGSITSKTIREKPGFTLRAEREALQITSHKRSCTFSLEQCGILSIAAIKPFVTATE
jgi:hypothetical protein